MNCSLFSDPIFRTFAAERPFATVTQMVLRRLLAADNLDRLFENEAHRQYCRKLLFSDLTGLVSGVVLGKYKSMNAGYKALQDRLGVSVRAIYDKLAGIELPIARELVCNCYQQTVEICKEIGCVQNHDVTGYQTRIIDGNWLSGTQHRIKETRTSTASPLPGKSLVVYDPRYRAVCDFVPLEDAYAQELSGLDAIIETLERKQLWLADRNFCTLKWMYMIAAKSSCFVLRQHSKLHGTEKGKLRKIGESETGILYEHKLVLPPYQGEQMTVRRIVVHLFEPTRDKDVEVILLTNLSVEDADAVKVSDLYRGRWKIETAFGHLSTAMNCEIKPLCYPKAALFCFATALVAYNAFAISKGAVAAEHGRAECEMLSHYYLASEIAATTDGMLVAIPNERWDEMESIDNAGFAAEVRTIIGSMDMRRYRKSIRGPKKKPPKRSNKLNSTHVSTKRILEKRK